jgi:MFS family permease
MKLDELLGPYRGLGKSIYVIFIASIINSVGNFVMPFLTIYLTQNLNLSKQDAGKLVMLAAIAVVPGSIIGGKLCDKHGRKGILIIFQALSALCFLPCAFLKDSSFVPWLLVGAAFFGGAASPAHMAVVTDLTNEKNRKSAYSLLYLGNNLGFALGPMIAGLLYKNHLPWIFIGDTLTTLVSLLLVTLYVKETKPDKNQIESSHKYLGANEKAEKGSMVQVLLKRPQLLVFSGIMIVYSFVASQYTFSIPIQVNEIFKIDGPRLFGMLMSVNAITVVTLTPVITHITIKYKPTATVFIGGLLYAVGFGMIYIIESLPMFIVSTIIWTLGEILVNTSSGVYVANNTPISHRGRFNSILPLIMGTGYAIAPYLAGGFMDSHGVRTVWILNFILSIGSAVLILCLHEFDKLYYKGADNLKTRAEN